LPQLIETPLLFTSVRHMETIRKKVLLIEKSASDQAAIEGMLADEAIACDLKVARSFREALEMMRT